ncbi:MAG: DUF2141 domain-containing protein [Myxococcota bacterium]
MKHNRGSVFCSLFASADGFPGDGKKAVATQKVKPADGKATCTFKGYKPGTYAAAAYHDENGNGELDSNWIGIPTEGVGASNNATGTMGPPKFKDARFTVPATGFSQRIKLDY